ncbi:kinesin-like protein KIF18A isoform X1 [Sitophilus oryzae]|uniref:Kinesin-like protein n=1 Tax=Sitophilus oryzae TaxID=7048 RepID=A0A6J2YQ48_SITOR|nr:kinesin-like protein KIF18A isoform X1 [Sitophilus oryzae]
MNKLVKMVKCDKKLATPRRRLSARNTGTISKVVKVLTQPIASTAPCIQRATNMTVVVRVRPPNSKERDQNSRTVVKVVGDQLLIFDPKEEEQPFFYHGVKQKDFLKRGNKELKFMFDRVCGNSSTNSEVYTYSTKSLVDTLMNGYNCSVFAYGATGAGKTYTMIGTEEFPGITFLTMKDLFSRKEELSSEREFELMLTYVEIYNEVVKDLLCPGGQPLYLREDSKYGVIISGVKVHKIANPNDLFLLLEQGNKRRTQHLTDANAESSRSHAVFQVYIHMTSKTTREVSTAKLSMIDLAGSERGSATGYVGPRFKEGANINRSLLALGNCINSLINGKNHIPYRDSKLTRLLKDSLGGNCHTVMIANVSPSSLSYEETYNTLKYANRAKSIKSNVKKNIVNTDLHIEQYIKLVSDLQTENATLKAEVDRLRHDNQPVQSDSGSQVNALTSENAMLTNENAALANENATLKREIEILNMTINALKIEKGEGDGLCAVKIGQESKEVSMEVCKSPVKPSISVEFTELVVEQKEAMKRIFELEQSILLLKGQLDEDLNRKTVNIIKNHETRKKLLEKFDKDEKEVQKQIQELRIARTRAENKLWNLLMASPELSREYERFVSDKERMEFQYKSELTQIENHMLLKKLSSFQTTNKKHRADSAVTPGTSLSGKSQTKPKRILQDSKNSGVNSTFVMDKDAAKTQTKTKTRQIAVKGYKTRVSKRFGPISTAGGKENNHQVRKFEAKKPVKRNWI